MHPRSEVLKLPCSVLNSEHAHDISILAASFHSSFAAIMLVSPLLLVPPDFRNGSKAIARISSSVGLKLGSSQLCPGGVISDIPRIRYAREINLIQGDT